MNKKNITNQKLFKLLVPVLLFVVINAQSAVLSESKVLTTRSDTNLFECVHLGRVIDMPGDDCGFLIELDEGGYFEVIENLTDIPLVDSMRITFGYELNFDTVLSCKMGTPVNIGCITELIDSINCDVWYEYYPVDMLMNTEAEIVAPIPIGYHYYFEGRSYDSIDNWEWYINDSLANTGQNVLLTFNEPGTYQVCLLVNGENCQNMYCEYVSVFDSANHCQASFTYRNEIPVDDSIVTRDVDSNYFHYIFWDNSIGDVIDGYWTIDYVDTFNYSPELWYTFSTSGLHNVCLHIETSSGCLSTYCEDIYVNDTISDCEAMFNISFLRCGIDERCGDNTYEFTDISFGDVVSRIWEIDGDSVSTDSIFTYEFSTPGYHDIRLTIFTSTGCVSWAGELIYIPDTFECQAAFEYYEIDCIGDTMDCGLYSYLFIDVSFGNIVSRVWEINGDTIMDVPEVWYTFEQPGTYTVTLTVTWMNECISRYTQEINVGVSPDKCFAKFEACSYSLLNIVSDTNSLLWGFKNKSRGKKLTYLWSFGDGTYSRATNPLHEYKTPGYYKVCLKVRSKNGCEDRYCKQIAVGVEPCEVDFDHQIAIPTCSDFEHIHVFTPIDVPKSVDFKWYINGEFISDAKILYHTFADTGNYNVCLKVKYRNGCTSKKCKNINVNFAIPLNAIAINCSDLPNINHTSFSIEKVYPNPTMGQLTIDVLTEKDELLQIQVLNILGEVIISNNDYNLYSGENRITLQTENLKTGTYIYLLSNSDTILRGNFTVIK